MTKQIRVQAETWKAFKQLWNRKIKAGYTMVHSWYTGHPDFYEGIMRKMMKKYKSCNAEIGQYCSKHQCKHKKVKQND